MELSDRQLERYARHIVLKDVGGPGQQAFLAARVLIVGAGGIGSPAALYLAAAGVGRIGLIDDDVVSLSNLQRQILYRESDLGRLKTEVAARRLAALNPEIRVERHDVRLEFANAAEMVRGSDLVIDGSDSFSTRLAVNAACVAERIPLVSAALGPFEGQLALFKGYEPELPCYRCFLPEPPPDEEAHACERIGILGALAGVVGSWAALETLRELAGVGESLAGHMLLIDGRQAGARRVRLRPDRACPVCAAAISSNGLEM